MKILLPKNEHQHLPNNIYCGGGVTTTPQLLRAESLVFLKEQSKFPYSLTNGLSITCALMRISKSNSIHRVATLLKHLSLFFIKFLTLFSLNTPPPSTFRQPRKKTDLIQRIFLNYKKNFFRLACNRQLLLSHVSLSYRIHISLCMNFRRNPVF